MSVPQVCNRVCEHVSLPGTDAYTRSLVVDYTGCPILFEAEGGKLKFDSARKPTFMADIPPMGEADIKFLRWAGHFDGDLIASSVDGDFIPIALMHHEARVLQVKIHEQMEEAKQKNQPESSRRPLIEKPKLHNITIFRIKYKPPPTAAESSAKRRATASAGANAASSSSSAGKKQKLICGTSSGCMQLADPCSADTPEPSAKIRKTSAPREYEYVNIPKLCAGMQDVFHRLCPAVKRNPLHRYVHYQ